MGRVAALLLALAAVPLASAEAPLETRLVALDAPDVPLPGVRVTERFPFANLALVEGSPLALDALAALPGVRGVYRDEPLTPNLDRVRALVHAEAEPGERWPTAANVTIALVDSGVDVAHPGFEGRIRAALRISRAGFASPATSDADGHGTHVAGILAGSGAFSEGGGRLHGLAPAASLVAIDISDSFTTTSAVRAFEWIHDHREEMGIRVVSNSWGREKSDAHYDPDDPVIRASDALVADGLVVVFSAGNRGRDGGATLTTEAMNPSVLTVGAVGASGRAEAYSSRGPAKGGDGSALSWTKPDLVAPGSLVLSTRTSAHAPASPRSDEARYYTLMNGTSMAAPQVAAAAALLLDEHADLSPALVAALLQQTARDVSAPGPDADTGFGMLDVRAALEAARTLDAQERRIVLESRSPFRHEGSVTGGQGLVLVPGTAPRLSQGDAIDVPLVAPRGAARIDATLEWSGQGAFRAELRGPAGASWAFARAEGGASLRLERDVSAGSYHVVAWPEGALASATYLLEGGFTVREERLVAVPAEFHSAQPARSVAGGFDLPASEDAAVVLHLVADEPLMVLSALIVVASAGAVGFAKLRKRR